MEFEELEVLLEPRVDLYDLAANEFDFRENFVDMGWMEYFCAEKKPIYTELVKEFWMSARVDNGSICGYVQGKVAIISLEFLPQVIKCYAEGVKFSDEWNEEEIKEELQGIIFEKPNGKSYSDLNPEYKVLYKIISGCILPLRNSSKIVTRSYKFIMWHYAKKISINLPELILNFLKRAYWSSRSGKVKTIPLGRVISGCLETFGIIDSLQRSKDFSIVQALKPSFGPLFNQITLARLKVRSRDVVEILKEENEVKRREASATPTTKNRKGNKSVASDSTRKVTRRTAIGELPPIGTSPLLSVIFPEDSEEVILEYRKIIAEDFLRANPNYISPTVRYEDYDEDNKDIVKEYMKKMEEEIAQEASAITAPESKKRSAPLSNQVPSKKSKVLDDDVNRKEFQSVASSFGIPKEPIQFDRPATSRSSVVVTREETLKNCSTATRVYGNIKSETCGYN
ncbi:hypothetical protein MTR_1g082820 [Medicago truncatula]|uniref:Putative plant transposon protein domain-containing protein n=1 Tax=Medicago truncatula TaxID=3880 RepID=G7I830_MEDTR|nr:hypothetical protein MTR_1g082820 [Medicago truncatula]